MVDSVVRCRPCSSVGQSTRLIIGWSQVQVLPGAPAGTRLLSSVGQSHRLLIGGSQVRNLQGARASTPLRCNTFGVACTKVGGNASQASRDQFDSDRLHPEGVVPPPTRGRGMPSAFRSRGPRQYRENQLHPARVSSGLQTAMAECRSIPLWRSWTAHPATNREAAGSNPAKGANRSRLDLSGRLPPSKRAER